MLLTSKGLGGWGRLAINWENSTQLTSCAGKQCEDKCKRRGLATKMSEEGEKSDNPGGGSTSSAGEITPVSMAAIVDSTVKVLLPQLSDRIEQQVTQAIKTVLSATSTAGQGMKA